MWDALLCCGLPIVARKSKDCHSSTGQEEAGKLSQTRCVRVFVFGGCLAACCALLLAVVFVRPIQCSYCQLEQVPMKDHCILGASLRFKLQQHVAC